jgi:hypothetical protein
MTYTTEQIPFVQGMKPGMGVNLVNGQTTALVFPSLLTAITPNPSFIGHEVCIETAQSYSDLIEVTGSVEGQAWTDGGEVTVNASAKFLRSEKYNAQALGFVCYKSSTTISELPTAETLNALQLPAGLGERIVDDPAGFLEECGTHVIIGFLSGGSFIGSVQVRATSESDMQLIQSHLSVQVKEFTEGSGKIDASFTQNLQEIAQTHVVSINTSGVGVNPPQFDPSTIQNMQDYIDNNFVTDLGTGVQLIAVCSPWEALPCVLSLPKFVPGSLSPAIDQGVLLTLRTEYRNLEYAAQTATSMQDTQSFVSPGSAAALQNDLQAIYEAQGRIDGLTFVELQSLNASDVGAYVVSTQYLTDLESIANGRAVVDWSLSLDGAFTPNTQSDPGSTLTGSTVVYPQINGTATTVLGADHGDGTLECGFQYRVLPVPVGSQPPTGLQNQVELLAHLQWGKDAYAGSAVLGSQPNQPSQTHWEKYSWDQITVWFGS